MCVCVCVCVCVFILFFLKNRVMINFKFGIGTFLGDNMNVIVMGYLC